MLCWKSSSFTQNQLRIFGHSFMEAVKVQRLLLLIVRFYWAQMSIMYINLFLRITKVFHCQAVVFCEDTDFTERQKHHFYIQHICISEVRSQRQVYSHSSSLNISHNSETGGIIWAVSFHLPSLCWHFCLFIPTLLPGRHFLFSVPPLAFPSWNKEWQSGIASLDLNETQGHSHLNE